MIPNIVLDKDTIFPLARRYLKDGRIKDPFLLRHFFIYFPENFTNILFLVFLCYNQNKLTFYQNYKTVIRQH